MVLSVSVISTPPQDGTKSMASKLAVQHNFLITINLFLHLLPSPAVRNVNVTIMQHLFTPVFSEQAFSLRESNCLENNFVVNLRETILNNETGP